MGKYQVDKQDEDAVLINAVNVEPLLRESIKAALKQDPVLSQVLDWLKTGVKPARCDVEGKDRSRGLPADLFARKLCASSVACPS